MSRAPKQRRRRKVRRLTVREQKKARAGAQDLHEQIAAMLGVNHRDLAAMFEGKIYAEQHLKENYKRLVIEARTAVALSRAANFAPGEQLLAAVDRGRPGKGMNHGPKQTEELGPA